MGSGPWRSSRFPSLPRGGPPSGSATASSSPMPAGQSAAVVLWSENQVEAIAGISLGKGGRSVRKSRAYGNAASAPAGCSVSRDPHEFDPAKADKLDRPDRQRFLPDEEVLGLLGLTGAETVVDYGAGTGTLAVPAARRLTGGAVHAVEKNPEMMERLRERLAGSGLPNARAHLVPDDRVPLGSGSADRILLVNVLHHVVGTGALKEMRRLLAPAGLLVVVDWRADVERDVGPPADVALSQAEGRQALEVEGFAVTPVSDVPFPYHFVLLARAGANH